MAVAGRVALEPEEPQEISLRVGHDLVGKFLLAGGLVAGPAVGKIDRGPIAGGAQPVLNRRDREHELAIAGSHAADAAEPLRRGRRHHHAADGMVGDVHAPHTIGPGVGRAVVAGPGMLDEHGRAVGGHARSGRPGVERMDAPEFFARQVAGREANAALRHG